MPTAIHNNHIPPLAHTMEPTKENTEDALQKIEEKLSPYLGENTSTPSMSEELSSDVLNTINQIQAYYEEKPIEGPNALRRLHALLGRLAEMVEKHLFYKKETDHKKDESIKEQTVSELQSWTRWQAGAHGTSAVGIPILLLFASLIPTGGEFLRALAQMTPEGVKTITDLIESWKMPAEHKKTMHVQMAPSTRQAVESLKNLPVEIQQLLIKLIDSYQQMMRSTGQHS